jgi:AraC-like DNA-binding protein
MLVRSLVGRVHAFSPAALTLQPDVMELAAVPEVPGMDVLRLDAAARAWRWYHEAYTVSLSILPAMVDWRYRGRTYRTTPGCIGLLEPGELHTELRKLNARDLLRIVMISAPLMQETARELGVRAGRLHWQVAQVDDRQLQRRIILLHRALEGDATLLERQVRASELLEHLITRHGERPVGLDGGVEPAALRRARAFLRDHLADTVSLDDLAAESGIGRFHLVRRFRACYGLPPHAYQMQMRLARAASLIRSGAPLAEVALETGFTDQSHLTKRFTRATGMPPGRYRLAVS